jgi:hypothetical protein
VALCLSSQEWKIGIENSGLGLERRQGPGEKEEKQRTEAEAEALRVGFIEDSCFSLRASLWYCNSSELLVKVSYVLFGLGISFSVQSVMDFDADSKITRGVPIP